MFTPSISGVDSGLDSAVNFTEKSCVSEVISASFIVVVSVVYHSFDTDAVIVRSS